MRIGSALPLVAALLALTASCTSPPSPAPAPPKPVPPPPAQPSLAGDWRDWPLNKGTWHYEQHKDGSAALFGPPETEAGFIFSCTKAARQIKFSIADTDGSEEHSVTMKVTTTYGSTSVAAKYRKAAIGDLIGEVPASSALLDQIAFSRGRFMIETPGSARLILPAWPEVARVIEDCRG